MGNIETVLSSSITIAFFATLLSLELYGMVQPLLQLNYLGPLVINGIRETSSKKYIKELVPSLLKIKVCEKLGIKFLKN